MTPKRTYRPADPPASTATPAMTVHGRHIEPGQPLTVAGIRGRVTFRQHVRSTTGVEWVDVWDQRRGRGRTIRPDAIRTVHRMHP